MELNKIRNVMCERYWIRTQLHMDISAIKITVGGLASIYDAS